MLLCSLHGDLDRLGPHGVAPQGRNVQTPEARTAPAWPAEEAQELLEGHGAPG